MSKTNGAHQVSLNNFMHEFDAIVEDFIDMEKESIDKEIRASARECLKDLKTNTPAGAEKYASWGDYQNHWKITYEKNALGDLTATIHQSSSKSGGKPGLTHLLEEGHVNANGHGRARAFPHIAPAAESAFEDLKRRLGNG